MNKQPQSGIVSFYKKCGETPLSALNRFRQENPDYQNATLSYAGRLDPMAEGLLLILIGDENNRREKYLHLQKTYTAEILFGFETDTYDILGRVTEFFDESVNISSEKIQEIIGQYNGTFTQAYPPFSSKAVHGKPLFQWAREGKLSDIDIPSHEVTVYNISLLEVKKISAQELLNTLENKVKMVVGDFRQDEIINDWQSVLKAKNRDFTLAKIELSCSSGTYVRAIIHDIGKQLKLGATTYSILRTKIGDFSL